VPVMVPNELKEQHRIVALLDEAFEGIATAKTNAEKNLRNAHHIFENHLEQLFATCDGLWPETSLGAIAAIKGGKRVPKGYKLLNAETDHPYLRVTDFGFDGSIDMSDLRYVSPEVHAEIKNYIITPRDLYISIAGTIGRTGIVPEALDGANLTENACRLVFKSGVSNRFVYYYTKTPAFTKQAEFNTRTAAQPKLALSRLATIRLPVPKFDLQVSVVVALDALAEDVAKLERTHRSKATVLDELKKSLLQQAFSGAL
jgi:type I restriction enzyme, S subunit